MEWGVLWAPAAVRGPVAVTAADPRAVECDAGRYGDGGDGGGGGSEGDGPLVTRLHHDAATWRDEM